MATKLEQGVILGERLEKRILKSTVEIQNEIAALIDEVLNEFDVRGGRFVPETDSAFILATLNRRLRELINASGLRNELIGFLDDFSQIDRNIRAVQSEINGITVPGEIFTAQKAWLRDNVINSLLESNVSTYFIQPVKQALYSRIAFGANVNDTEKTIRGLIKGTGGKAGIFERWVGQVARDSIFEYQGAINQQVKVEFELNAIRYVGGLVEDSRPQCVRWVEKYNGIIKDKDLAREIEWAYKNGSGMKPDTTPQNFCQKRGGYACQHIAIPTRV
jgi:hypothetical protein